MTQKQRKRTAEAYDILVSVFNDMVAKGGNIEEEPKLYTILRELENLMREER